MNDELDSIMKYYGLDSKDDAEKVQWILSELQSYGNWGQKVSSYFSTILSGTPGTRTLIPQDQIEAFKSLFADYDNINA